MILVSAGMNRLRRVAKSCCIGCDRTLTAEWVDSGMNEQVKCSGHVTRMNEDFCHEYMRTGLKGITIFYGLQDAASWKTS